MDRRLILFLILSFFILTLYPIFLERFILENQPFDPSPTQDDKDSSVTHRQPAVPPPQTLLQPPIPPPAREEQIVIETDLYRATISTKGGTIRSWELKQYLEEDRQTPVQLLKEDLVPYPLTVMGSNGLSLAEVLWHAEPARLRLSSSRTRGHLVLSYYDPDTDISARKRLTFHNDTYQVEIETIVNGASSHALSLGVNFGINKWVEALGFAGATTRTDGRLKKDRPKDLSKPVTYEPVEWVAAQDRYFVAALIPEGITTATVSSPGEGQVHTSLHSSGPRLSATLYAGPKVVSKLRDMGVGLESTVDFGWFIGGSWWVVEMIAKPLFAVLLFIHRITHNFGVAIILVTVGVRVLFIPLAYKAYRSMKAMQEVQPKVQVLQKKYKDDKSRLQQETVKLYREHRVNPLGGCLPLLLQLPVFIALFNILSTAIELRQAPLMLWILDLSEKDPYYVLPIMMGGSMAVQQYIQPTSADPTQARLMMFMPIIFTFFFLNFPSGLVLYWLANNLLSILQQYITVRYWENKPAA